MSTFPINTGGPTASSSLSASHASDSASIEAIMLARHDALKGLVEKQAEIVHKLNEQLRTLSAEKAELAGKATPTKDDKDRLNALDEQLAGLVNQQSIQMTKLQDLANKMTQSLEIASSVAKKFYDAGAGLITNLR